MIKSYYSLYLINEILNRLNDIIKCIKLNLKNAYHRIRIKKDHKWKIAFYTRYKYFKYIIISFNLIKIFIIF